MTGGGRVELGEKGIQDRERRSGRIGRQEDEGFEDEERRNKERWERRDRETGRGRIRRGGETK